MPRAAVPAAMLARLRSICSGLEGVKEEQAWTGTRWVVRGRTFAHVLTVDGGKPPAYARAAGTDGPATVLTFRTSDALDDALRTAGPPFFHAPWGTRWSAHVVGVVLGPCTDWGQLALLLQESWSLLAPRKARGRSQGL